MKKLMKGAVLGTLASVLLLSGCSNEQAAPANEEKRVCTVDNGGVEGLDMTVTATGNDEKLNTVEMAISMNLQAILESSGTGVEFNMEDMTDELKTQVTESMRDEMSKQIADELGLPEDAFTADASIDGNTMNINMTMDVSKMGDTYANSSLDEFAQTIEDDLTPLVNKLEKGRKSGKFPSFFNEMGEKDEKER